MLQRVIEKISEQQKSCEGKPAWTVGEHLKDILRDNPDVMEFKALFDRVQKDVGVLFALNDKIKANDTEMAQKLKNALKAFFEKVIEGV